MARRSAAPTLPLSLRSGGAVAVEQDRDVTALLVDHHQVEIEVAAEIGQEQGERHVSDGVEDLVGKAPVANVEEYRAAGLQRDRQVGIAVAIEVHRLNAVRLLANAIRDRVTEYLPADR